MISPVYKHKKIIIMQGKIRRLGIANWHDPPFFGVPLSEYSRICLVAPSAIILALQP
jgi:hypothetical protein